MKLDAVKRQGARNDLTSAHDGQKLNRKSSGDLIAENSPDSSTQIQRFVRLYELIPELLDLVDQGRVAVTPAVELSYLNAEEQVIVVLTIESEQSSPSLSQAQRIHPHNNKLYTICLHICKKCDILKKPDRRFGFFACKKIDRKKDHSMLNVNHVTKKYGKTVACNDLNFCLEPGSVTVLLGPNGAGKSTIMKAMIGFLRYDGEITVNGNLNKTVQARRILGYIPEMPSLYPNLTVSEHLEFLARAYSMKDYKARADELLERFELADKRKKFGDELSKGMQQKLNICLGLLPDPEYLLLDEPMIGLDPHAIKELKSMIEQMRQRGKTILVSTHIIDSVDMLWDRTIILQNGVIRANLTRQQLEEQGKTLEELFFEVTEGVRGDEMQHTEE